MRHPIEHAEHEMKYGCLRVWLLTLGGILYFFWPLAIGAATPGHVQWWTWLIEVPWLIIAISLVAVVAARRRH